MTLPTLSRYEPGICFLCRGPTADPQAYLHHPCARAYFDAKKAEPLLDKLPKRSAPNQVISLTENLGRGSPK